MDTEYAAPGTPLEASLCAFWSDVLKVPRVGVRDRFDELGGNSLLAVRVAARLLQSTGIEIPVRSLFDHPTIAELAAHVEELRWASAAVAGSAADPDGEDREEGSL